MIEPSYPSWLPKDWKDGDGYPNPKTTIPKQWAWEFLRRNPNYQSDFDFLISIPRKETKLVFDGGQSDLGYSPDPKIKPTKEPGEIMNEWLNKYSKGESWLNPYRFMADRYGLFRIVDPEISDPFDTTVIDIPKDGDSIDPFIMPHIELFTPPVRLIGAPSNLIEYEKFLSETRTKLKVEAGLNEMIIALNLLCEIKPQLEYVESKLNQIQEELQHSVVSFVYQKKIYRRYLQVLDASKRGLNIPQIAEGLFPEEYSQGNDVTVKKRVEKNLQAAEDNCKYLYRFIASHTP